MVGITRSKVIFHSTCLKYCACHEKVLPGHTKCCTCHAKSSQQTSDAPKCNPSQKISAGPPNSSDEHVSCTAPATENASLQIFFKCPTPAIVFGHATKPSRFAHFDKVHNPLRLPRETTSERPKVVQTCSVFNILTSKCVSRHNGIHFFDISTSKSAPKLRCFAHFDFEMCFAPQCRALFHHLNFQKWSATTACTFSTSQLPKVVRSGPNLVSFVHFDFQMCFAPQRRATFHLASYFSTLRSNKPLAKTQCFATFLPFRGPASSFF